MSDAMNTVWSMYLGHRTHGLSNTEVAENVFRYDGYQRQILPHERGVRTSTKESVEWHCAVVMLDEAAHTRLGDTTTTEDLNGVLSRLLCRSSAVHLQERDLTVSL